MGRRKRNQHCMPPGATGGNNRKHAKRGHPGNKPAGYGKEFMLYCVFGEKTKRFESCHEPTAGGAGSRAHRFGRGVGFEASHHRQSGSHHRQSGSSQPNGW